MPKPMPAKARPAGPAADKSYDIPVVSFRVITDDQSLLGPAGVHSDQARNYGYNDFSEYQRPEHYIRYIEPIESELAVQVEYDMDEQDQEWLDAVNADRKKDQSAPVTYEMFEIIMDKLEKEWFNLIKRIPQPVSHLPVEDSKCAICDDGEGENSNAIVFCDGCNLAVHQDCYGVPYIPEGQWLCRKCTVSPENPVSCLFCPNEGGAFKQTTTGHWSHLLCAIWIPELSVGNAVYMEPVEGVEMVPKNRWKLICSLCKERVGACIQCENKSCFTAFHVTCARQMGLLMSMKLMGADGQLRAYCDKHLPAEWREGREEDTDDNDDDYRDSETDAEYDEATPAPKKRARANSTTLKTVTPKTARAHTKSYRPGPPIVPHMIVTKLLDYVAKLNIRKKQQFVERLCRYWSLKREARRGAPLLKRLHLEPWTATSESREQTDAEKAKKLEFLIALRNDLEKVRLLAELVRKREKEKLRQALVIQDVVDNFVFPHYITLRETLATIVEMDKSDLFFYPVSRDDVPDYYDVIKEPMSWSQIEEKLDYMLYLTTESFRRDIYLVLDNAMEYNKGDTPFHRAAARIKKSATPVLDQLNQINAVSSLMPDDDDKLEDTDSPLVGDLEPALLRLKTLLGPDQTASDDSSRDMLASIFVSAAGKSGAGTTTNKSTPLPPPPLPSLPLMARVQKEKRRSAPPRSQKRIPGLSAPSTMEPTPSAQPQPLPPPDDDLTLGLTPAREVVLEVDPQVQRAREEKLRRQREESARKKRAKEEERIRKRDKERERRRLRKLAAARARGEIVDDDLGTTEAAPATEAPAGGENVVEKKPVADVEEQAKENVEVERRLAKPPEKAEGGKEEQKNKTEDESKEERSKAPTHDVPPSADKPDNVEDPQQDEPPDSQAEPNASAETATSVDREADAPATAADPDSEAPPTAKTQSPDDDALTEATGPVTGDDDKLEAVSLDKAQPKRSDEAREMEAEGAPESQVLDKPEPESRVASDNFAREDDGLTPPSSPGAIKPPLRRERGVLGVLSIPAKTDRERREEEKRLDLITPTVDPLDEYRRFNVGWILPEGSKRKRTSAPPPPALVLPPSKKRRASQTPSVFDSDSVSVKSDRRSETSRKGKERAASAAEESHMRKADYEGEANASSPLSGVDELTPIPETLSATAEKFPDLRSSLSPPPEEEMTQPSSKRVKRPSTTGPGAGTRLAAASAFPPGTLVWAKVRSYPYFPAIIVDPVMEREIVPEAVLNVEASERAMHGRVWLAHFYDKAATWAWLPASKLHPLGTGDGSDELFLAGRDRPGAKSMFRGSRVKTNCKIAYKLATESIENKQQ